MFLTRAAQGARDGIRCVRYDAKGGATASTHYCARTFENAVWQAHAVYEACKAQPDLRPDLIVGHSGFGSMVFLQELYPAPIVSYARNAMILLDLHACAAGYAPTHWRSWSTSGPVCCATSSTWTGSPPTRCGS